MSDHNSNNNIIAAFADSIIGRTSSSSSITSSFLSFLSSLSTTATTSTTTPFPAEHLLQSSSPSSSSSSSSLSTNEQQVQEQEQLNLPNWEYEIIRLQVLLFLTAIVWLIIIPYIMLLRTNTSTSNRTTNNKYHQVEEKDDDKVGKKRKSVFGRFFYYTLYVPITILVSIAGWLFISFIILTFISPYNSYVARRVFQTPIFTSEECERLINISHIVANENIQLYQKYHPDDFTNEEQLMLYEEPYGWQKVRHEKYPTTDLNIVTDPFQYIDQQWVQQLCNQRIAPILSRIYGIPIRSIQARDMFIVRYDANLTRHKLAKHTDGGDISFTIFLNHEFDGGGTQFWNRHTNTPFHLLQSHNSSGQMSTFASAIEHEGYPTTKGIRMIMVGFLDVVRYDEDEITSTGLSIYASWFNWNWMLLRLVESHQAYEWESKYWRKKTARFIQSFVNLLDHYTKHAVTSPLIRSEQLSEFIQTLEQSYNHTNRANKARWIEGQQKKAFLRYIDEYYEEDDEEDEDVDDVEMKEKVPDEL